MNPLCPYCGEESKLVKGNEIYCGFANLQNKNFYECLACDAHVGCHEGTSEPLGSLADFRLREARNLAHKAFDPIWKARHSRRMNRKHAYSWLSRQTGIPYKECHMGQMNIEQCELVISIINQYKETW